jgi:hypothetical protein
MNYYNYLLGTNIGISHFLPLATCEVKWSLCLIKHNNLKTFRRVKEQLLAVITSGQERKVWYILCRLVSFPRSTPRKVCLESVLVWTRFRQNSPSIWSHTLLTHLVFNNIVHYLHKYACDVSITLRMFVCITVSTQN